MPNFAGDIQLYNAGGTLLPCVVLAVDASDNTKGTVLVYDMSPDDFEAHGPDPKSLWSPDPIDVDIVLDSAASGQVQLSAFGRTRRSSLIMFLSGFTGTGWSIDPGVSIEAGGSVRTNIPGQKLILSQRQTVAAQRRSLAVFDAQDLVGAPMTLEVWVDEAMQGTLATDGDGIRKFYEVPFPAQDDEHLFTTVVYSGALGGTFYRVFGVRIFEDSP